MRASAGAEIWPQTVLKNPRPALLRADTAQGIAAHSWSFLVLLCLVAGNLEAREPLAKAGQRAVGRRSPSLPEFSGIRDRDQKDFSYLGARHQEIIH